MNPEIRATTSTTRSNRSSPLGSLVVPESSWQALERELEEVLARAFPEMSDASSEIHAADLRTGKRAFKGIPIDRRITLRDDWLLIAKKHQLKLIYRSIEKKRYQKAIKSLFGPGIALNPHVAAFALVAIVVDEYLAGQGALGMFISDENKEIVRDVEKSIRSLRLSSGPLRLSQIVEKGFFIDSSKSRVLQLCDLCIYQLRKHEERLLGLPPKGIDDEGVLLAHKLVHRGNQRFNDVLEWLKAEQKSNSTG